MVFFFTLAAIAVLPAAIAQNLMINTPTGVVQCQPVQLSWVGGTAPYFLSFIPAGQSAAPPIKQFPTQNGNSFTWTADLASGSTFTIALKDSAGSPAFSDIVTVQSGPDSSCINTSISEGGTGGAASPTSAGGASGASSAASTPAGTTTSAGASNSGSSAKPASSSPGASSTSSAATSSSTAKNSASNNKGNALAVAGVMGLVGAALF